MIQLKNKEEIEGIRKSGHLLADLFRHLDEKIEEGMSTYDVLSESIMPLLPVLAIWDIRMRPVYPLMIP